MVVHKVLCVGGSAAVVIPKNYLAHLGLVRGDLVIIKLTDNKIELSPLTRVLVPEINNEGLN